MTDPSPATTPGLRVRIFVDFWNLSINVRNWRNDLSLDYSKLGPWLTARAGEVAAQTGQSIAPVVYEGMHVYLSYDPMKDAKLRGWALSVVDRFPGVQVVLMERKPKHAPNCPACRKSIDTCPHCTVPMRGTLEKGIDTAMVTDMIKLAWESSYDIAVIVSGDRDFIPAVQFLDAKGRKVINATVPPLGSDLARNCWGSFDLRTGLEACTMPKPPPRA